MYSNKTNFIIIIFIVSFVLVNVYIRYVSEYNRIDISLSHSGVINQTAETPHQYRILLPYIVEYGLKNLFSAKIYNYYRLIDLIFLTIAFWALLKLFTNFVGFWESVAGMLVVFLTLPFVYLWQAYFPASFQLMFYSLGLYLIYIDKKVMLFLLILLGALNREISVFLIFTFGLVYYDHSERTKYISWGIAYLVFFVAIQALLRYYIPGVSHGHRGLIGTAVHIFIENFTHYKHILLPLILMNITLYFSFKSFKNKPQFIQRIMFTVPAIFLALLFFGRMIEVRLFIPVIPYMVLSSIYTISSGGYFQSED